MSEDQDPMLGDEATQNAYQEKIMRIVYETIEETRAERRQPGKPDSEPVMLGAAGFDGNLSSAT